MKLGQKFPVRMWIFAILVAILTSSTLWLVFRSANYPVNGTIEITLIPGDYRSPPLQLAIDETGMLHLRKYSDGGFFSVGCILPSNTQSVLEICDELGTIANLSGPKFHTSIHPNVMIRHNGYGSESWTICWNSHADYMSGDLWGWIDLELHDVRSKGSGYYEERSERALALLKQLSEEFKVTGAVRDQLKVNPPSPPTKNRGD